MNRIMFHIFVILMILCTALTVYIAASTEPMGLYGMLGIVTFYFLMRSEWKELKASKAEKNAYKRGKPDEG